MNTGLKIQRAANGRGFILIEFAIAVPILLVMLLATAEVGRCLYQYNTLTKQVLSGVRYAVANASRGSTGTVLLTDAVKATVKNLVIYGNEVGTGNVILPSFLPANVQVDIAEPEYVRVAVEYSYVPIMGATLPMFGIGNDISLAIPLKSSLLMRAL